MILNLLATIAAATMINPNTNTKAEDFNQQYIGKICQEIAIETGITTPNENQFAVKDLDGNIFIVETGEMGGMLIYDPVSDVFLEKSATLECPYDFNSLMDYYYFGPMNYFYRIEDTFISLDNSYDSLSLAQALELQEIYREHLETFRESTSAQNYQKYVTVQRQNGRTVKDKIRKGNKTYINGYEHIRNDPFPKNNDNSCGFVAACIVLNYWDKTVKRGIVNSQFLNENGYLNSTDTFSPETNLKDKLVQYNGGKRNSTAISVSHAMNKYCKEYGVKGSASWHLGNIGITKSIATDRPAILFGWISDLKGSLITHAVTVYGIEEHWWGGYFIVNYGWENHTEEVMVGFGLVGTTATFSLDKDYYAIKYDVTTIKPTNYGFADAYPTDEYTKNNFTSHYLNSNFTFKTKRYRTGYIHQEYIVMSCIKTGITEAFIEYEFDKPIYKIEVEMAHWREFSHEWLNKDNGVVKLQTWQSWNILCTFPFSHWQSTFDFLSDEANLTRDRTNPSVYTIEFIIPVNGFRFYSKINNPDISTSNRGRICIGNMNVYTLANNN